ncbi:MAG TPA: RNA polymerase factor sigma-54 [Bacteroidales bacterium]|nr:MAG: RNA polymerase sigma-54 factor [Bacteroidetes bacterium ADurb.Bin217]HOS83302.1 RNA polymerase factor sigma-54 [Bacteroidales bacterium]HPH15996.1 RNA polymerase factor sigma-54 [Bacteroidales bacterium]
MLNQKLQQKLQQKLSPQQIQVIKMLEIPTMMLEQRIKEELEENPALEMDESPDEIRDETGDNDEIQEDDATNDDEFSVDDYFNEDEYSNYKYKSDNYSSDQDNKEIPFSVGNTFHENLIQQLGLQNLNERELQIAEFLLGNIDEDGYLRRELENIVDDIMFAQNIETSEQELQKILTVIQSLDPPGVGATSLQQCLLLQITRKQRTAETVTATAILRDYYTEFTKKHYDKIQQKLDIESDDLKDAIDEILKLNPKPGSSYSDPLNKTAGQVIVPDFIMEEQDGELIISLHSRNVPELKISKTYANMLMAYKANSNVNKSQKDALTFVKQKLDSAKWFIDAIKQRHETLLGTMHAIFEYQKEFFISGDETKLRPMILKDIADKTMLDVSTISRVANSKYIQTPFGIYALKYFFSEGLQNEAGEEVSSREIKKILQEAIAVENKSTPYTDEELVEVLKEKGYIIARRTIAKYREQLGIPVGRLRKEL